MNTFYFVEWMLIAKTFKKYKKQSLVYWQVFEKFVFFAIKIQVIIFKWYGPKNGPAYEV